VSRVLVRKADIVYDVMTGRPQLQVGVGARRDNDGRRMMPTFGGEGNLVAVQDALKDRAGRIANIEREIPVDPRTGFRSSQDEKEFQHAMGQLGSGFASDQERIAFNPRDSAGTAQEQQARFANALRNTQFYGKLGQGIGAAATGLVGVMSGLSALEGGQGPLAAGLTGYTAAQQLRGLSPYLTEAGMRYGAHRAHRNTPRVNTTFGTIPGQPTTAEPTTNNTNTTGPVNPTLDDFGMTGGAVGVEPTEQPLVGVEPTERVKGRSRRNPVTDSMTATGAAEAIGSHLDNNTAPPYGIPENNPRTANTEAELHGQSSTAASSSNVDAAGAAMARLMEEQKERNKMAGGS